MASTHEGVQHHGSPRKKITAPSYSAQKKRLRTALWRLIIPSLLLVIIGILSPHLFEGHMWVASKYAATLFLLVNFSALFLLFFLYVREIRHMEEERHRASDLLIESYQYMGLANRKIDVISEFVNTIRHVEMDRQPRSVIQELLDYLANGVCKSGWGSIRFVRREKLRTLTEWVSGNMAQHTVSFSNKEIMSIESEGVLSGGFHCIVSDYGFSGIRCAFIFPQPQAEAAPVDTKFIRTLLNQIFLLTIYLGLIT